MHPQVVDRWAIMGASCHADSCGHLNGCVKSWRLSKKKKFIAVLWIFNALLSRVCAQTNDFPPSRFIEQPSSGQAQIQGNRKVLLCFANGVPNPAYRWQRDDVYLTPNNVTESSLIIDDIQRTDAGTYQCTASNVLGAILSDRVRVHVAYMVPFTIGAIQEKVVQRGQARIIDLPSIDSYPAPNIYWYNSETTIQPEALRYYITLAHQLVVLESTYSDNDKQFYANAVNSFTGRNSQSNTYVLKIQDTGGGSPDIAPSMVVPPSHTTAIQGSDSSVILECVVNARPLSFVSLKWYRVSVNSRELIEASNFKHFLSLYQRRLTIRNPVTDDTGVYECVGTFNRPGDPNSPSVSAQANLTIYVRPSFISRPPSTDTIMELGASAEIPCEADGAPQPTVTWYRNAQLIDFEQHPRFTSVNNRNLRIENLQMSDSGMFQCFATNDAGEVSGATWLRVVSSAPTIHTAPQNQSTISGTSARLDCDVSGAPQPVVTWTREFADGTIEELSSDERIQINERELLIQVTEKADTAVYTCNAVNNMGETSASAYLNVITRTRIVTPPQDAAFIKGSTKVLQCAVDKDADIIPTWQWFHQNVIITEDARRIIGDEGSLTIRSIRNSDIGIYKCKVTSDGGNDEAHANITVIELPYSPVITSVSLNPDEGRAVDLSWTPGFDGNSPIIKFSVEYRMVPPGATLFENEGWILADANIPTSRRQYTIRDLQPSQHYQFGVAAVNDVGEGPGSTPSNVIQIPQEPPSGPPLGVVGSPRSDSSILLQWQPPSPNHWNGDLEGYSIRYKLAGYPDSTLSYEDIQSYVSAIFELNGLIVFQEYEIAVAAYNAEGIGVYSNYIRVRTQEGVPDRAPTSVSAAAVSSTAFEMAWQPPDPQYINGINQGYKIEAQELDSSEDPTRITIPSDTSNILGRQVAQVAELKKYTDYELTVLCFTSKGDGPKSEPVTVRTLEDVPEQVASLTFIDIRDTSVTVTWTPPLNLNGILMGYTLNYMRKGEPLTVITREFEPEVLSHVINGLTATTVYTVEVFARTRAGAGLKQSSDIESGIPPELPEAPRNLAITNIEASSVLLQFIPGFSGHTSISKWIIEGETSARVKRQVDGSSGDWHVIYETTDPDASSLTVTGLTPYTRYRLRMTAENIAGQSEVSEPTRWFETIQAPPGQPPMDVTMRAVNQTTMRVTWTPLSMELWYGEERGYRLEFMREDSTTFDIIREMADENANSFIMGGLQEFMTYSGRVAAYNSIGISSYSPTVADTTRESVPSAGPQNVRAEPVNSTSIRMQWGQVPLLEQNGEIEGYKVLYKLLGEENTIMQEASVAGADASSTHITGLKKFRQYQLQVRAFTRIGDGTLSSPPIVVRTHEDVPGPPASVYFPEVTWTTARIVWSPPTEPNGLITFYRVSYRQLNEPANYAIVDDEIASSVREKYLQGLERDRFYVFAVTTRTSLGWGEPAELKVRTVVNRRVPDPPLRPSIQQPQIGDRYVTIQWQAGNDNYSPIRNYTVQYQKNTEPWVTVLEYVPHDLTVFTITGLKPNTRYSFHIAATNDVGTSAYSSASDQITTKQAAPESPPVNLTVTPQTRTSVLVKWEPPAVDTWNGDLLGYNLEYKELDSEAWTPETINNPDVDVVNLQTLELFNTYEFRVRAFNMFGESPWSPVLVVYVEIVPTAAPEIIEASNLSSTEIQLVWQPPPEEEQNGDLLGYKIYYWQREAQQNTTRTKVVAGGETSTILTGLGMFAEYSFIMLAFNAAGDGPNSTDVVSVKTDQGVPGPPGELAFTMTSLTSLNVSWTLPLETNGIIRGFRVSYYRDIYADGERRSVTDFVQDRRYYYASELVEDVEYVFSVMAKTDKGWGPAREGSVITRPHAGSPEAPEKLEVEVRATSIKLSWANGYHGDSPIQGYIIQARKRGDSQWQTVITSNDPEAKAIVPISNLRANSFYQFRVIALNRMGISYPSKSSEYFKVEDKSDDKPFYQQWWFLVIVALLGVIFIITVVLVLCITGIKRKEKYKDPIDRIPRTTLQLSNTMTDTLPGQDMENDDGLVTIGSRHSQRRSHRKVPTSSRRSEISLPPYSRHPPRPSPGSVNYEEDAETHKSYAESETSDMTEKPSEASSSDQESQHTDSDNEADTGLYGASASGSSRPNSFVTSYVANGDVRNSWKRQRTPHVQNAYNYTDSEQDSSHYATSLNGGVILMNNMAGSRAPLPGFSSFV